MQIGIFNMRGISLPNFSEHFIKLELEELRRQGHHVELYWAKGRHPIREEVNQMDFAIYHFVPTALYFRGIRVPYCILPTANDVFLDEGERLKILDKDGKCKFIGYQSFYHKRKYDEWGITKPTVYIPHCARTELFKRKRQLGDRICAGGRLIPKKGLDRVIPHIDNLLVFGDGQLKEQLQQLNPTAKFTGFLNGKNLRILFEGCWLYLFPAIITPEGDSDGIPNSIKEALLMQLQVIASPIAGIPELKGIHLLDDWSKKSIEEAIRDIPKEPNIIGEKYIRKIYNPESCVNRLIEGIETYR